ncbi:hypothetical protein RJT34_30210 [Clitoria ternatea]|uniref:Uncharacterized protein n=1 Tax=Clitoria ternatea TaxID=43366 RepID=A0AAN9EWK4_CLITE
MRLSFKLSVSLSFPPIAHVSLVLSLILKFCLSFAVEVLVFFLLSPISVILCLILFSVVVCLSVLRKLNGVGYFDFVGVETFFVFFASSFFPTLPPFPLSSCSLEPRRLHLLFISRLTPFSPCLL